MEFFREYEESSFVSPFRPGSRHQMSMIIRSWRTHRVTMDTPRGSWGRKRLGVEGVDVIGGSRLQLQYLWTHPGVSTSTDQWFPLRSVCLKFLDSTFSSRSSVGPSRFRWGGWLLWLPTWVVSNDSHPNSDLVEWLVTYVWRLVCWVSFVFVHVSQRTHVVDDDTHPRRW